MPIFRLAARLTRAGGSNRAAARTTPTKEATDGAIPLAHPWRRDARNSFTSEQLELEPKKYFTWTDQLRTSDHLVTAEQLHPRG